MAEKKIRSPYNKDWMLSVGIPIAESYGDGLTLRGLHYRLVNEGMTNDIPHYKNLVAVMTAARWNGLLDMSLFTDHERETIGETDWEQTDVESKVNSSKWAIEYYLKSYSKNRWENQDYYVECFIEKKTLIGVFDKTCERLGIALNPCKGYPSLTYLYNAAERFKEAEQAGKTPVIIYFGDYDCSGEDIPRSIQDSLFRLGVSVEMDRRALMLDQVEKWNLPPAPTKDSDSRSRNWNGIGQVELDAVKPSELQTLLRDAVSDYFDDDLFVELQKIQATEKDEYKARIRSEIDSILENL